MIAPNTELRLRETRVLLEDALRESLESGSATPRLVPAVHDFAAGALALTPDLTPDALVNRVFRLILHVARSVPPGRADGTLPVIERVIALGKLCAEALRAEHIPLILREVASAAPPSAVVSASAAADARSAARVARENARSIVSAAIRARTRSTGLMAASVAERRAASELQAQFRSGISRYVSALRQLGEPADSVITEVRVLTLECASDVCAPGSEPEGAWAEALHDEVVLLAIDAYYDAPAA